MTSHSPEVAHLREALERREVLVVIGTGVSRQVTSDAKVSTWPGLLENGIEFLARNYAHLDSNGLRIDLADARTSEDFIRIAGELVHRMNGPDGFKFRQWLSDSVGSLSVAPGGESLLLAITGLDNPLLTTNYDNILSDFSGYPPYTWKNTHQVLEVMKRHRDGIVHLHGHHEHPDTVIFDQNSYRELLRQQEFTAIRNAMLTFRSLLFIGCGAGLADPHFSRLRSALELMASGTKQMIFRLCTDREVPILSREHALDETVTIVGFGGEYTDLTDFLRALAPSQILNAGLAGSFLEPIDTDHCGHDVYVAGAVDGVMGGVDLWLVKEIAPGIYHPDDGPMHVRSGRWSGSLFLGNRAATPTSPERYKVHLVATTHRGSAMFKAYLHESHSRNSWTGVPSLGGGTVLATRTFTKTRA